MGCLGIAEIYKAWLQLDILFSGGAPVVCVAVAILHTVIGLIGTRREEEGR